MRRFDVLTFDCYGTLIDWERGIAEAFGAAARADGVTLDRAAILRAYHEIEPVVQAERYRRYRDVLAITAGAVADRLGWKLAPGREAFLPVSLPSWPPFPDTNEALRRLRDAGQPIGREAAMTKLFASETAVRITDEAARIFASYGLAMEYPVQRYFRDARFLLPGGGTSEILRLVIGRELDWDRGAAFA